MIGIIMRISHNLREGARSPTARWERPTLSRYWREPLPSQILTLRTFNGAEEVEPEMNQRSSARTARRNTRLVVRRGRMACRLAPKGQI